MAEFVQAWYCKWGLRGDVERHQREGAPIMTCEQLNRNLGAAYDRGVQSPAGYRKGAVLFGTKLAELLAQYSEDVPRYELERLLGNYGVPLEAKPGNEAN